MLFPKMQTKLIISFILTIISIFPIHHKCFADIKYTLIPFIGFQTEYDDNIFLDRSRRCDLITTISPGINFFSEKQKGKIGLYYSPGFTYFRDHSEYDYTSHSFSATGEYRLTEHMNFDVTDDYVRTNEPSLDQLIEYSGYVSYGGPDTGTIRELRTRNRSTKNINVLQPRFTYQFGPENFLRFYYRNTLYKDEDPTVDDFTENFISSEMEYWFNIRNGVIFTYEYLNGDVDISSDFDSHSIRPRYTHRFTEHFELYGEYRFLTYDFENEDQSVSDFDNHESNIGFNYQYSPHLSFNGYGGYYIVKPARRDTKDGYNLSLGTTLTRQHLTFNFNVVKGYDVDYFILDDSGYSKYWGITTGLFYDIRQNIRMTAWGAYFKRDYQEGVGLTANDREDDIYRFNSNIVYNFSRFASFELGYVHEERSSSESSNSYIDNRIMAMITFFKAWSNTDEPTETPTTMRPLRFGRRR
jgi:hypothetical protein